MCRSQWPCGLRSVSAAARLLGFGDRIPPEAWMSVSCVLCVVRQRYLPRDDPSSGGVLASVVSEV